MPLINPVAPNTVPALPLLPLLPKPQARVGQLKGYNQGLVPIVSHEVSILHTMPLMAGGKAAKDALKRVEQAIQSAFPGLTAGVGAIAEDTAKALNKQA